MLQKGGLLIKVFFFTISLGYIGCSSNTKSYFEEEDWLSVAIKSEKYIQIGKLQSENGQMWKEMPDSINSGTNEALYRGASGVVLFYLELFNATGDSTYLNEASKGADYLLSTMEGTKYTSEDVGLYTGLAGIGFTLSEVFKVTGEKKYKAAVLKTVNILESSSKETPTGIHWDGVTDVIYGSAGIGLYLQHIASDLEIKKADSLSVLVANGLLDNAIIESKGLRWKAYPGIKVFMDNFSHGASGIAYFLAQTYKRTKEEKYLNAARKAAEFLDSIANEKGYVPHHLPNEEELFYLNWCHGPGGTSRLYYILYEITNDKKWLDKITKTADQIILEGIDKKQKHGYWNNVGKCCGDTGVAEYYFWLYQMTGNTEYLKFSERMTQKIISLSTVENDHIKWIHAENRVSPDATAAQTGLMQGSAGMGLWFLQINAFQKQQEPLILLPDKPQIHTAK